MKNKLSILIFLLGVLFLHDQGRILFVKKELFTYESIIKESYLEFETIKEPIKEEMLKKKIYFLMSEEDDLVKVNLKKEVTTYLFYQEKMIEYSFMMIKANIS